MSNNDLRTKVTDLPICTDIEQLDTILGIGKDNAMYRVDSENIGGGGKWIPLTATIIFTSTEEYTSRVSVNLDVSEIQEAYNIGGKIHVIVLYRKEEIYKDIEFLISPSYALPVENDMNNDDTELGVNFIIIPYIGKASDESGSIFVNIIAASLQFNKLELQGGSTNQTPIDFEFVGIFFEPIKNIGDLSKVSKDGSSAPA